MTTHLSIISRLKKIAITSLDLGKEIAKDKATQAAGSLRESRAGHFFDATRQRFDKALGKTSAKKPARKSLKAPKTKAATLERPPASGKRHLGAEKYSAKAARLTPH